MQDLHENHACDWSFLLKYYFNNNNNNNLLLIPSVEETEKLATEGNDKRTHRPWDSQQVSLTKRDQTKPN